MSFEFLILISTYITNYKQKIFDIKKHNDFLLEALTKKRKKAIKEKIIEVEINY